MDKLTSENVVEVLRNFATYLEDMEEDDREPYVEDVEDMLDFIHSNDGFGTEGQCDPRGDARDD
jgi:hypothetical protein